MISYNPYLPADAHEAVDLWNNDLVLGKHFPLDLKLWRQNVEQSAAIVMPATLIARDNDQNGRVVGMIVTKSPKHLNSIVVAPTHQRQGIGTELMRLSDKANIGGKDKKWVVGQDYDHFFPGVPEEAEAALKFLTNLGMKRGKDFIFDLSRGLSDYAIAPEVAERIAKLPSEGIELGPCRQEDLAPLVDHIAANFSQRWLANTISRLNMETNPGEIIVARRPATGDVIGFAHTFSSKSRWVGPSIMWRPLLGPKYGGLGPIGVAKDERKIGLGLALCSFAIQSVKDGGATQMAIDWTVIINFYAKMGFKPWKRYIDVREA